jgi:hypothetical protein
LLAPESPWWLIRQNRIEDARTSLVRLTSVSRHPDFDIDKTIALMVFTTKRELEINKGISFRACFRGTDLRRTLIVMGVYCMQVFSGAPLRGYATYFFQQAGLPTDQAFNMSIVGYGLGIAGVASSVCASKVPESRPLLMSTVAAHAPRWPSDHLSLRVWFPDTAHAGGGRPRRGPTQLLSGAG